MRVLNIGGNNKDFPIEDIFFGNEYEQVLLDIDPAGNPDLCMDARDLQDYHDEKFDAVYCSHNLEHFSAFDIPKVTHGAYHVLKEGGRAVFKVPYLKGVLRDMVEADKELEDVCYNLCDGTAIHYGDVIFGWQAIMENTGQDFFAHKWGFSTKSLGEFLKYAGFKVIHIEAIGYEILALCEK